MRSMNTVITTKRLRLSKRASARVALEDLSTTALPALTNAAANAVALSLANQ